MVVGEGITNDAVGIIIFNTVMTYAVPGAVYNWGAILKIIGSFTMLCTVSTIIGFLVGLSGSLIFKVFRNLTSNPTVETVIVFCMGYISYLLAEFTGFSGIISVLSGGFTMSAFVQPNLSPAGQEQTSTALGFLGALFEGYVFSCLGLSIMTYVSFSWSV